MADEVDIANEHFARELSRMLENRRNATQNVQGPKQCIECGEDMPKGRRDLGFKRCVPCAEEVERRKSLFADG